MTAMSDRLLAATRKGLFAIERDRSGTWTVRRTAFLGSPVTAVERLDDGALLAALNLGHFGTKLHRSEDGETWTEVAAPAYPQAGEGADGEDKAPAVKVIWTLAAGGGSTVWAGTLPGGLFRSDDGGRTWALVEALWNAPERANWFGGGYDDPGIHSILPDPRDMRRLTVGVSCGGVWRSEDAGASWRLCGSGLCASYMPPNRAEDLSIQDAHRLACCREVPGVVWCQHHNGMFRSEDGGETFETIPSPAPSGFGFAVGAHPGDPLTAWFVPAESDQMRVPVGGRLVVTRTTDGGKTFEVLSDGLPGANAWDLVYRHGLDVDETGERLAIGSTTGGLWLSENGGRSWRSIPARLPPIAQVRFVP
jgi:hypothetical protein